MIKAYFDLDKNFWEVNRDFTIHFFEFYDSDTTKSKDKSSKIMWCVALLTDNKNSPLREKFIKDKRDLIKSYKYLFEGYKESEIAAFDKDWFVLLCDKYANVTMTRSEVLLEQWYNKTKEMQNFIDITPFSEDNYKMLTDLIKALPQQWKSFEQVKKDVLEEHNVSRGGQQLALLDQMNKSNYE